MAESLNAAREDHVKQSNDNDKSNDNNDNCDSITANVLFRGPGYLFELTLIVTEEFLYLRVERGDSEVADNKSESAKNDDGNEPV